MGNSLWIGADYGASYTAIFEEVTNSSGKVESNTYRAKGNSLGFHIAYNLNNYSRLFFQLSKKDFDLKHNSALLADIYSEEEKKVSTAEKVFSLSEYYSYRFQYYKRFYPKQIMFGAGIVYDADIENLSDSTTVKNTKKRIGGVVTLGTEFSSSGVAIYPFIEYIFPITKYKELGINEIHLGEFAIGIRFSMKLF